jgi:Flp pilus assembly protein TadG
MKARTKHRNQEGVVVVWFALMLIVLIAVSALAIDVGYLMATRNELQNISDAAALAGARQMGKIYADLDFTAQQGYTLTAADVVLIQDAATGVAGANQAGGQDNISIASGEIDIGVWYDHTFTEGLTASVNTGSGTMVKRANAVRVIARRDGVANGPIGTFFFSVLGIGEASPTAFATAALTGKKTSGLGELELPVGIDEMYFTHYGCQDRIRFYPTGTPEACAGWTSFSYTSNDPNLRDLIDGDLDSPEIISPETGANFTGGNLSTHVFDKLLLAYRDKGYDVRADGVTPVQTNADGSPVKGHLGDAEGTVELTNPDTGDLEWYPGDDPAVDPPRNMHVWETTVIVYEASDCDNPNQSRKIVGFAPIRMTDVFNAPNKFIEGKVICDLVENGISRGDGGDFGLYGSVPGLVE